MAGAEDDRRTKLERLREQGVEPFPHVFDGVVPAAAVHAAHDGLADGEETDDAYRIAGRLAARRGHGGAAFLDRGRPLRPPPGARQARRAGRGVLRAPDRVRPGRPDRRRRDRVQVPSRRADPAGHRLGPAGQVAARPAREVPRPGGCGDALPPSRAGPDRQRGVTRAVHPALASSQRRPALAGRARLPRGRDADPAAAVRRRPGSPVRHPPQRAGPRPLPAHRRRAVPQAPDRRRPGEGLRDRQGLPQRGRVAQAQPRVHDARVVRGLRRLHADRARSSRSWSRSWPARSATKASSTSRLPGAA